MGLLVLGFGPVSYLFIFYIRSQYGNAQYNSVSLRAYPLSFDVCLHVAHLFVSRPLHSGRLMDNLSFSSIWLRKSRVWFVYIFYVSLWCGLWYVFLYCDVDVYVFKYLLIVFFWLWHKTFEQELSRLAFSPLVCQSISFGGSMMYICSCDLGVYDNIICLRF